MISKPLIVVSYPSTVSSLTVYSISLPSLYFGKSVNEYFHPSASVTIFVSTTSPSANKLTVIDSGRLPSWLSASFQVLAPLTSVVSGL